MHYVWRIESPTQSSLIGEVEGVGVGTVVGQQLNDEGTLFDGRYARGVVCQQQTCRLLELDLLAPSLTELGRIDIEPGRRLHLHRHRRLQCDTFDLLLRVQEFDGETVGPGRYVTARIAPGSQITIP